MQNRIKEIRKDAGLSQEAFADKIGLTRGFIAKVETGISEFSDRTISDICRIFGVSEKWLLTGDGEMYIPKSREQEVAEIVSAALANATPAKRDKLTRLLVGVVAPLTDGEIEILYQMAVNHGYIEEK